MADKPTPPQAIQIQVEVDGATANGVFVNSAFVNHTETEFTLDLIHVQPQLPGAPPSPLKATVRARAITTPKHMKRLLLAIQDTSRGTRRASARWSSARGRPSLRAR
jgi:hypothetical protein